MKFAFFHLRYDTLKFKDPNTGSDRIKVDQREQYRQLLMRLTGSHPTVTLKLFDGFNRSLHASLWVSKIFKVTENVFKKMYFNLWPSYNRKRRRNQWLKAGSTRRCTAWSSTPPRGRWTWSDVDAIIARWSPNLPRRRPCSPCPAVVVG